MKVKTERMEEVMQAEYDRHKRGEVVRDPCISPYFLQRFPTVGDLAVGKGTQRTAKIIHCPSDEASFLVKVPHA